MRSTAAEYVPEIIAVEELEVNAYPNPSNSNFTIQIKSNNVKEKIILRVYDVNGKMIEMRNNITLGTMVIFGDKYISGAYYARIMQGREHKEIKLIKLFE